MFRAVLAEHGKDLATDSTGTGGWHAGEEPDRRSIAVVAKHGVGISGQRARKVLPEDFSRFNLILGMNKANVRDLKSLAPPAARDRIHFYLDFATGNAADVPDPYYDGAEAFASVYRMIREASEALAKRLDASASPTRGQASSTM